MSQQTNQTEVQSELNNNTQNQNLDNNLYTKDYTESDLDQLIAKPNLSKAEYLEMIDILDFLKQENVISTHEELEKTEKTFSYARDLNEHISRIQATFPSLKNESQQNFFDQAVKTDLNNLDDVLAEFRPLLADEQTKPYFDGVQLVETSFIKNIKGLGINYTSPSETKRKQEEDNAKLATESETNVTYENPVTTANDQKATDSNEQTTPVVNDVEENVKANPEDSNNKS